MAASGKKHFNIKFLLEVLLKNNFVNGLWILRSPTKCRLSERLSTHEVIQYQLLDQNYSTHHAQNSGLQYTNKPSVRIIEQPAPRSLHFRYKCEIEGRPAGSIVGIKFSVLYDKVCRLCVFIFTISVV
ncbi:hypothetical protein AVEN_128519-1 [Araneus ventricosus]|uniref:RHD domain-containing protein n=1 Tax=Araneus ventricosus TaxID=182803 RepID=A0A4Y2HN77_ARAVE|nr:hypothetical protein AVEN_128519-1 [Araneus ventricosus]